MCLNFIPEQGKTWLYSSGKPGIRKLCLRIRYINTISLRQSFYPWMIRDILCWMCLRRVEKLTAILLCNWLWIIQHCWFSEYPEYFGDFGIRCAQNSKATNNLDQSWRSKLPWVLGSCLQISVSQFHTVNIVWWWAVTAAWTDSHKRNIRHRGIWLRLPSNRRICFSSHIGSSKEARIQFTRYPFTIDFISYSSP